MTPPIPRYVSNLLRAPSVAAAPARPPQQVFISYGRADAMAFAQRPAADLKERGGHHVWLDLESIETGDRFDVRIERGIRTSDVVAAVMTTRSVAEDSLCRDEVVFALNEGKKVVPKRRVDFRTPRRPQSGGAPPAVWPRRLPGIFLIKGNAHVVDGGHNGVEYRLLSCDHLSFEPRLLREPLLPAPDSAGGFRQPGCGAIE